MPGEERGVLTELVFLGRGPLLVRAVSVLLLAVAVGVAGAALADVHASLNGPSVDVSSLNPLQRALRTGSSSLTAWPGWAAATLFGLAVLRLHRGPVEPAAGRKPVEAMTTAELRRGLRREYTLVRALLCFVLLIAAVEVSRTCATAIDVSAGYPGGDQLPSLSVEALGYVAAGVMLLLWAHRFAGDVRRLGAR